MKDEYYLQDYRSYVGNDILFWALGGGYTTDVSKAEIFTKEKAVAQNKSRESDIPWPKEYIDKKTRPAVDMQYVWISDALKDTGIKLAVAKRHKRQTMNCHGCGRFLSEYNVYNGCPHCDADNRP